MNTTLYIYAFLLLFIAFLSWRQKNVRSIIRRRRRNRRNNKMNELIQHFLGKTCTFTWAALRRPGGDH